MKVNGNNIFCEKHQGWFFSLIYARKGIYPVQCPVCKSYKYDKPRVLNNGNKNKSEDKPEN